MNRMLSAVWVTAQKVRPHRWAAEFYRHHFTELEERLGACGQDLVELRRLAHIFSGPFGSVLPATLYNSPNGIPLLRVQNIGELFVNESDLARIPREVHEQILSSKLEPGDVALAKAGRLGALSRIPDHMPECNITQHIVGIRIDSKKIQPGYLAAFLLSRFGRFQLERQGVGTLIKYLGVEETRGTLIPIPDRRIQAYIGTKVDLAERCRSEAVNIYYQFEELLQTTLTTLKLVQLPDAYQDALVFHATNSELDPIRIDSKYYRTRFIDAISALKSINSVSFSSILEECNYGASVPADYVPNGIPFVRGIDLQANRLSANALCFLDTKHEDKVRRAKLKIGDVLITRSGTVGIAAAVDSDFNGYTFGSYMIRMRFTKDFNPFYVAAFLNSPYGAVQVERLRNGAVQENINLDEIGRILIPVVDDNTQELISSAVRRWNKFMDFAGKLIFDAKSDAEALIEGALDTDAILSGKVKPPTWETITAAIDKGE